MKLRLTLVLIAFAAALLADSKQSKDLLGQPQGATVQVIVQYNTPPTPDDLKGIAAKGGTVSASHAALRSVSVTIRASALDALAANPNVAYISLDRPVRGAMDYTVPTTGANLAQTYGYSGSGVT